MPWWRGSELNEKDCGLTIQHIDIPHVGTLWWPCPDENGWPLVRSNQLSDELPAASMLGSRAAVSTMDAIE